MAKSNVVLEGALVYCTMAPKIKYGKIDHRSFESYQYVFVDDMAREARTHSAYQGRKLLLNEKDVLITPFSECLSPYYEEVLADVIAEKKACLFSGKNLTKDEKGKLESTIKSYRYAFDTVTGAKGHPCAMLVLDKWFQPSS